MENRRKVSYFYDGSLGDFYYGPTHPMKPHRVRMAHDLIVRYDLYRHLKAFAPVPCCLDDMAAFHSSDYLAGLQSVDTAGGGAAGGGADAGGRRGAGGAGGGAGGTTDASERERLRSRFNLGVADCPVFPNIFKYCQSYTGASIGAAVQLNYGAADVCINWAGGLHHARKGRASGFCYINDIVLATLELLKYHRRVLYLDIDVHHGDGVEEAFYTTDRVLTVSFHKYDGEFFPGTGNVGEVGAGPGRHYAVNVPLEDGIDDDSFLWLFKSVMRPLMAAYQPDALVLQSGADSLAGDRLGKFNLTIQGHAAVHAELLSYNKPLLVLGGGGYKIVNVARCWTYETAVLLGRAATLSADMPPNEYYDLFKPDFSLFIRKDPALANANSRSRLDKLLAQVLDNVRHIRPVDGQGAVQLPPGHAAAAAAAAAADKQQQQQWADVSTLSGEGREGGQHDTGDDAVGGGGGGARQQQQRRRRGGGGGDGSSSGQDQMSE